MEVIRGAARRPGLGLRPRLRCGSRRVLTRPGRLLQPGWDGRRAAASLAAIAPSSLPVWRRSPTSRCRSLRRRCWLNSGLRLTLPTCPSSCAGRVTLIKKTLLASERERADVKAEREEWHTHRLPAIRATPARLVFIDETSVKTNMTPLRGRSLKGERLVADAPFGKWNTQTFIAGLRCDELIAPWVIDG